MTNHRMFPGRIARQFGEHCSPLNNEAIEKFI